MRPPSDAWAVSSTLHLLDTAHLSAVPGGAASRAAAGAEAGQQQLSPLLVERLGWAAAPRASVLCAQLMEVGRMHAVVRA